MLGPEDALSNSFSLLAQLKDNLFWLHEPFCGPKQKSIIHSSLTLVGLTLFFAEFWSKSCNMYTPSIPIIPLTSPCVFSAGEGSGIHTPCGQSGCAESCIIPHSTHPLPVRCFVICLLAAAASAAALASWHSIYGLPAARSIRGKDRFIIHRVMSLDSPGQ